MTHHHGSFIPYNGTPFVIGYLVVAVIVVIIILLKNKNFLKKFNAIDYAYMGVGGALVAVMDHVVGDAIFIPSPFYPWINPPVYFRVLVAFIVIALVRKFGAGMITMGVYDIISDIVSHFSFTGEPLWLFEDILTYGLMADIAILLTRNNLFVSKNIGINVLEGALLGLAWSVVHPFFTFGFIAPEVFGFVPNATRVFFLFETYAVGLLVIGAISAIVANRVAKLVA